jgi:hypothetical protein
MSEEHQKDNSNTSTDQFQTLYLSGEEYSVLT